MEPYLAKLCQDTKFTCIKVHRGDTWENMFADPELRGIVMRFNRMDVEPKPNQTIVVPDDMADVKLMDLSPFDSQIPAPGEKTIIVNPSLNAWGAYDAEGHLVKWGPASTGSDWCSDTGRGCRTTSGDFSIYRVGGPSCASTKFPLPHGGAPMPYCMFFDKGEAIHGSDEVMGYNASHGCVRIFVDDARWLNKDFIDRPDDGGTKVIVLKYPEKTQI